MKTLKEHAFPTLNLKPDVKAKSEKIYKCEFCESSYARNASLEMHIESVHEKMYTCSFCGNSYTGKNYLKEHIENCCKVA